MTLIEKTEEPPRQQFRSSTESFTTSIQTQVDPVTGSFIVLWRHIQHRFPNIRDLRHGNDNIECLVDPDTLKDFDPLRIHYYPDVVLEVIQGDPSLPSLGRGDGAISHFSASSHKTSTPNSDNDDGENIGSHPRPLQRQSTNHLMETSLDKSLVHCSKNMTPQGQKSAASYNRLYESYAEAMIAGRKEQTDTLKAHMDVVKASLMEEMEKNHAQFLEKDRENKEMQQETLNRLVVIQNRVQTILTQTYELFEYPIPRLFIVLPKEQGLLDKMNPFTHEFKVYFLCECGDHTKKKSSSSSKISHHIHLAKHPGYDLLRPTEFFEKYGPYLLIMMEMVKFGIAAAGVVVPALTQLGVLDGIEEVKNQLDFTEKTFAPLLDGSISYVKNHIGQDLPDAGLEGRNDLMAQEALEGADLRQLASYLSKADEARTLGNLYRTVTEDGHVKWVCFDHYRDGYMDSIQRRFADIVATNEGEFMEDLGQVRIGLRTPLTAQEFYDALKRTKGVQELIIFLKWDATKSDIQQLCDTIFESNVSILTMSGGYFSGPISDVLNRGSRFDPFIQMIAKGKLQSFTIKNCHLFPNRISDIASPAIPTLRALHLDYYIEEKESKSTRQTVANLFRRFPNLIEATVACSDIDEMLELLPIQQLSQLSVLRLQRKRFDDMIMLRLLNGTVWYMSMRVDYIPKLAYSGSLRQFEMVYNIMPLPDLKHLLDANMGLTKLRLRMPKNPFEYISLIGTLMSTRCSPLQVVIASLMGSGTAMEFWNATKVPPSESTGKWIQLPHSMVHIQEWHNFIFSFQQMNSNIEIILSGLEEMAHDAGEVKLDLDMSLLTEAGIRVFQKAMASLRPRECSVVFKEYKQELAHCYDFDPMYWSKLSWLTVSGEDMETWLQRPGSAFKRELMPSLRYLRVEGQGSGTILSGSLANWLASMVSSNEAFQSLTSLEISKAHFSHEDWRTILGSIDYSSLELLRLDECGLADAFPGSRKNQEYNAADICRHVGLGTEHQEQAVVLVLGQRRDDYLVFSRK